MGKSIVIILVFSKGWEKGLAYRNAKAKLYRVVLFE